eukprot:TRINITY_DN4215_c2_g1_i1.p1 TRINITY_DN4215_c2_g1~~TRINITY_DN4215_c2_g1_i1.p1  ORF type:complete len:134 (+),score=36.54 TRINITY_DN4215_c2_g1_i1:417-818(+)
MELTHCFCVFFNFEMIRYWVKELETNVRDRIVIVIAGNKCDLEHQRRVSKLEAQHFADSINSPLFETSAKQNSGIEEMFLDVAQELLTNHREQLDSHPSGDGFQPEKFYDATVAINKGKQGKQMDKKDDSCCG